MLRCAILDDYQRAALECADWSPLAGRVSLDVFDRPFRDKGEAVTALAPYDIVVAMRERTPFPAPVIAALPRLRLVVTTGARNAAIDIDAAARRGITVCGTGSHPGTAAEHTWALILALVRRLDVELPAFRGGGWQSTVGRSLAGSTLGVVGLGRIGTQMAAVGRAFAMRVVGLSRSLTGARATALGIERAASLDELVAAGDIVTLHVPLTRETRGMIGAREIARFKAGAVLVNTSRGPIVDESALVAALRSGALAGAALDVYDREPLPADHPLRTLRNVVATPHLGFVTRENYRVWYRDAVEDILAWLAGAPIRALVPDPT